MCVQKTTRDDGAERLEEARTERESGREGKQHAWQVGRLHVHCSAAMQWVIFLPVGLSWVVGHHVQGVYFIAWCIWSTRHDMANVIALLHSYTPLSQLPLPIMGPSTARLQITLKCEREQAASTFFFFFFTLFSIERRHIIYNTTSTSHHKPWSSSLLDSSSAVLLPRSPSAPSATWPGLIVSHRLLR